MNLPTEYVFSFFSDPEAVVKEGNRLIREMKEMYSLLSYHYSSLEKPTPWMPTLVSSAPISYSRQTGKHIEKLSSHEFFFFLEGTARRPLGEIILSLPEGKSYSSLPTLGTIKGKIDGVPFIGEIKIEKGKYGEVWSLGRIAERMYCGKTFRLEGSFKVVK